MKITLSGTRGPAARVAASIVCLVTLSSVAAACGSTAKQSTGVASIGTDKPAADDSTDATSDATPDATDDSTGDSTDSSADGSTDDTTDDSTADSIDPSVAMVDFTECMRDNGIDMPDPQVVKSDGSGNATTGGGPMIALNSVPDGEEGDPQTDLGFDPESDEFKEAQEACQPILDEAATAISIDPEVEAEHREQMLDFAKCMRDHGIDFPDPTFNDNGGGISISVGSAEASDGEEGPPPDDEAFQEANTACADLLGDGTAVFSATPGTGE